MTNVKTQDQRSLLDQLQDVWEYAIKEKMYDAADFITENLKGKAVEASKIKRGPHDPTI